MEQNRGRSPSQGRSQHISPIPSPHGYHDTVPGVDPAVHQALTSGKFNTSQQYQNPFLDSQTIQSQQGDNTLFSHDQFNQGFSNDQFTDPTLSMGFNQESNAFMYQNQAIPQDWSQGGYSMNFSNIGQQTNINPADLSKASSPHDHQSPNLLNPDTHSSPGAQPGSPASINGQFYTPQHSRHTSLDPSSAYGDVMAGANFQNHRRAPSDVSDVSSTTHSPFLAHQDLDNSHSPYLAAQQDTSNTFGIDNFTLGEQDSYRSPRLMPHMDHNQPGLGVNPGDMSLNQGMGMAGPEIYTSQVDSYGSNHLRHLSTVSDIGQADQFAPPTINIEPAPVSRQASFGPQGEILEGALSPPQTSRGRSKSDVTYSRPMSRSVSPGRTTGRLHSDALSVRSYSPGPSVSRESSPGPGAIKSDKNRRASTSSINSRDYVLDLIDPNRPNGSPSGSSTRVQKHPATYHCHLCTKKFTRAYNLRSHLRTHTDERPFVCTVCGKAFARQHDRKRHEGLHSGEKKFVCKGELHSSPGQYWGCGRRFARADALGRHFRSEAGRVCIKPLLEEEKVERETKVMMEQQQQQMQYQGSLQPVPQPLMIGMDPTTGTGGFSLPAALLAQYPALQNIDWSQVATTDDAGDLSDVGGMGGRPSFDGSSGGEFYEDDISEGYASGSGMNFADPNQQIYMGS